MTSGTTTPSAGFRIHTAPSRRAMGVEAAAQIAGHLRTVLPQPVRMIFAAAPSQAEMLDALIAEAGIDWSRVTAFHMDEYVGLDPQSPARFAHWLDRHLFDRLPFGRVHRLRPDPDPEAAAREYATLLREAPIDIVCLGIGVNGHLAFNDPPVADFNDPLDVKRVELDAVCRQQQVDDGGFPTLADVPREAVTLTIPRLLDAGRLFCVVPGPAKRDAVRNALHGPLDTSCPASILRQHHDCVLFLDPDSAADV